MKIELNGYDFRHIVLACSKAASKNNVREALRYIELRADGKECVATALDGFIMQQVKCECKGKGVVLIPADIKTEKADTVIITAKESLRIAYYDENKQLILAVEMPKAECAFVDWNKMQLFKERPESVIHCDARYLRKIVAATTHARDQTFSICIPENKTDNIRIVSGDSRAVVLPLRVSDPLYERKAGNWFKDVKEA